MKVRDIMTRTVHRCGPDGSVTDATRIMWEHDVGAVPVIDATGRPIGMITDRDICMAAYTRGQGLREMNVSSVMSRDLYACRPEDPIAEVERTMMEHQVRRLPVVDATSKLVGIISLNDIALARARNPIEKAKERLLGDVTETLAAICKHGHGPAGNQARA